MSPICKSHLDQLSNPRWQRGYNHGARSQRLLWASTGTKDAGCKSVE
jgi:transaldolase